MYLSVKEFCFFSLIFVVITLCLFVFNKKFITTKDSYLHLSSFLMASFVATLSFVITYKFGKIGTCQTDNFHFEVSPEKKCRGYPYMQSGDPKLLEECTKFLSSEEGKKTKSCDGMYVGKPTKFEYTPETNDQWENKRCNTEKNTIKSSNNDMPEKIVQSNNSEQNTIYQGNSLGLTPTYNNRHIKGNKKNVSFQQEQEQE